MLCLIGRCIKFLKFWNDFQQNFKLSMHMGKSNIKKSPPKDCLLSKYQ